MSWVIWAVAGGICVLAELFTLDFTLLMLGVSCGIVAGISIFVSNIFVDVLFFALISIILIFLVRPFLKKKINTQSNSSVGSADMYIGYTTSALSHIDTHSGNIEVDGEVWGARTTQGLIPKDEPVRIVDFQGITAIVEPVKDV
ncbi:MAG: NfeD family protein [Actinomycetaceae bacterium]|nr:NfeD family protein [Actinomycetaceae bacterium]